MKTIALKKLNLINFKGAQYLSIDFDDKLTNIFGENGTYKTTSFDGFTWLLFGKDSSDRKDFQIKTLTPENGTTPKTEHEVNAEMLVDGITIKLRKVLKENWVKKRGGEVSEFTGNVTDYYWNDVPVQLKEYQAKVSSILDEQVFKMITNPYAFNSLKWQERRVVLTQIGGAISDEELAGDNAEFLELLSHLVQGKTLEDYRKQVMASITKAKQDVKLIPARIDEANRSKAEDYDFDALRKDLTTAEGKLAEVDKKISDKATAFDELLIVENRKKLTASTYKRQMEEIENEAKEKVTQSLTPDDSKLKTAEKFLDDKQRELATAEQQAKNYISKVDAVKVEIETLEATMQSKRDEWGLINAEQLIINEEEFCCPTCKRDFEAGDIETKKAEMLENFTATQREKKKVINDKGKALTIERDGKMEELELLEQSWHNAVKSVSSLTTEVELLKGNVKIEKQKIAEPTTGAETVESLLEKNKGYQDLKEQLRVISSKIQENPAIDNVALIEEKNGLIEEIDAIKTKLRNEEQNKAVAERVVALGTEEATLITQIANVEKTMLTIEKFNRLRIDALENSINDKFKYVKFKMFDVQINGGESECCEALINGVPFSDANTASKVNAGLDIINALCDFYQVSAPIFIDSRESVLDLIETDSQIINLIVSKGDKVIRVA